MLPLPSRVPILVVGAGPAGLTLSAELARRGVTALTIDRLAEGANTSRAAVVHARTLEVLEPLGVVSDMLARGLKVPIFRVRDRDRTLLTLDFRKIPSRYAFTLMCPQDLTEGILLATLHQLGGDVARPAEVAGLRVRDDGAEADVVVNGVTRTVDAAWVVGCDGMHSRVRQAAGIPFEGDAYEQDFVLADVHMDWPLARDEVSLFLSPDGLVVVAPLPGDRFRIVATVDAAPEQLPVDVFQQLLEARGPRAARAVIRDSVWASRFRVHHRLAHRLRQGRVLLCGDAAHVHSPAGGQGMNTGIQDAMALAGVLAEVHGGGDPAALDAWAAHRHLVAEDVVAFTDRMTRMAMLESPLARALRNMAIGAAGHLPFVTQAIARKIAELDQPGPA
jgi:2-polyprenyl-6-methoxyphenol hydroxylase-like FAD-dependent oxidoreductase